MPRQNHAILSIVLVVSSFLLFMFQSEIAVFNTVSIIMSIGAILLLVQVIRNVQQMRLSTILALSLLLGYGVGTFNTVLSVWLQASMDVVEYFDYQPSQLAIALIVPCLTVSTLLWISRFEESNMFYAKVITIDVGTREQVLTLILALIVILAVVTGNIGFQGIYHPSMSGQINIIGAIASIIHPATGAFAVYCFYKVRGKWRLYFGVIATLMIILLIPQGRRILLYSVVLFLFAYMLAGGSRQFRIFEIRMIMLLGATVASHNFCFRFFL